ncbi:MAG: transporter [Acidobacteriota bacterium]|nr:transporter [Acidobacteriota bacterium]
MMKVKFTGYLPAAWLLLTTALTAQAQQTVSNPLVTDTLPPVAAQTQSEEEEFIKPARPTVANPAEVQKAGVLQLEYGYDGNFRAAEFRAQQGASLALRFAATSRLLFALDLETVKSETDETQARMTGVGDTRLGFQAVALKDTERYPALAFAYYVKLPSASESKGLGTGRVDHKFLTLVSKKFGEVEMDLNGAVLIVGREEASGWVTGGQGALAFSGEFENGFGLEGEISGQTKDDVQPKGLFALGALTYKVNRRLRFDGGLRFGLNPDAPRVGVFAGLTVGVADFYKRR